MEQPQPWDIFILLLLQPFENHIHIVFSLSSRVLERFYTGILLSMDES